jgi:hypothetical protein
MKRAAVGIVYSGYRVGERCASLLERWMLMPVFSAYSTVLAPLLLGLIAV